MTHVTPKKRARLSNSGAKHSWRTERRGSAALEFALIAPVFFLLLLGIMELGRMFWMQVTLRQAVEQTARYAMAEYTRESFIITDDATFTTWFNTWTSSTTVADYGALETIAINPADVTFTVTKTDAPTAADVDTLTVQADYAFDFALIIVPGWTNQTLTASATIPLIGANSSFLPP